MRTSPAPFRRSHSRPLADVALAGAAWLVFVLSCAQLALCEYGRDQGIYAAVADTLLRGGMPYRDAWDFKPPAIFVLFGLAQAWFGKSMIAIRVLEVAGLFGVLVALRRISRSMFGSPLPGLLGAALAAWLHVQLGFWHTAQPEAFGGMLTVYALAWLLTTDTITDLSPSERAWSFATFAGAGVLFGVAFLFKPPLGGAALPCALFFGMQRWHRQHRIVSAIEPALALGIGAALPIGLCVWWFVARQAWPALSWTLFEFTPGYTRLGWSHTASELAVQTISHLLAAGSLLLPVGLLLWLALPPMHARERQTCTLVLGVAAVQLVGVAMQAKFFPYHYSATLPLLAFVVGVGLYKAWRVVLAAERVWSLGIFAYGFALITLMASGSATATFPDLRRAFATADEANAASPEELALAREAAYSLAADREAAQRAQQLTRSDESIYVWGFEPAIYWLAERRAASRYIYNVPQRSTWERKRARDELLTDLHNDPPKLVFVQRGDTFPWVTGNALDSAGSVAGFPELAHMLASDYRAHEVLPTFEVYIRR